MRRMVKVFILSATIAAVFTPALAHADGYISPFVGTNFGNSAGNGRVNVGADAGFMGAGVIGAEVDFGYAPNIFGDQGTFGSNSVIDLMANLIVGVPAGGTHGFGLRPYATIGGGLLRSRIGGGTGPVGSITNSDVGLDAGGGVMGFWSNHLGIRADVRYLRSLTGSGTANSANIDFGAFHYWRASVGIILRP